MDLEISRITDCASWHTVVGMEYSTVFDKCPSPVNWEEPKRGGEGVGAEWLLRTKLFHTVLCEKPCDNRAIEKRSTVSLATLCIWWPGTESNCRHKDFQSSALPTELPGQG